MLKLAYRGTVAGLRFCRYLHRQQGIIETLTKDNVTYVRLGLMKPNDQQQPAVAKFTRRSRSPSARAGASARGLRTLDEERRSHVRDRSAKLHDLTRSKPRHKRRGPLRQVQA
jgi:hypothetical protein